MTYEEIKGLLDVGFTKEEIMQLNAGVPKLEQTQAIATIQDETPIPLPQSLTEQSPAVPSEKLATAAPMTDEQLTKLAHLINADRSTFDVPPARSLDDTLAEHYKALIVGENAN